MGGITLQRRQSISFGSVRNFRFGSAADMQRAADRGSSATPAEARNIRDTTDWAAVFAFDPHGTPSIYEMLNARAGDGYAWPTVQSYLAARGNVVETIAPNLPPVVVNPATNNPPVVYPGTTQAEYEAARAADQVDAAKLAALASAKQAANAADSKRIAAEDELARRNAEIANQPEAAPKIHAVTWLIAAAALLVLKG